MFATKRRACGDKTQYESRQEANDGLWFLVRTTGAIPGKLNVYECRFCGWYHIGHKQVIRRGVRSSWSTA